MAHNPLEPTTPGQSTSARSTGRPFAATLHMVLIALMLISFALIAQQSSQALYHLGFLLLIASTFVQIVFGNVPPETDFRRSMALLGMGLGIVAVVFALGILLAPILANLGR